MKTKIFWLFVSLFIVQFNYGQLKVNSSGKVIIGPDTTWADYNFNITGSGTSIRFPI